MNIYELIQNSQSFAELRDKKVLPDPYDDSGFYYVYYAQADYKTVLPEIIGYIENGLRIYYNRYYDKSNSFISDYLSKVKSVQCKCAVIYLSENALKDPVFYRLLKTVSETGCNYLSINLPVDGNIFSGEQIANKYVTESEHAVLLKELFKNEITYIPSTFSLLQKIEELKRAYRFAPMHYSLCEDFAVADYVYDLQEDSIIIPSSVLIGGTEYSVKAVRRGAFANCGNLKKIVFPDTVEYIGFLGNEFDEPTSNGGDTPDEEDIFNAQSQINYVNGTFYRCKSLEEIVFPPRVKMLYEYEFCGCSSLKRIILNDCLQFYVHNDYVTADGFFELRDLFSEKEKDAESDYDDGKERDDIILEELQVPKSVCKIDGDLFKICIADLKCVWIDAEFPAKKITGYSLIQKQSSLFIDSQTFNIPYVKEDLVKVEYDNEWNLAREMQNEYCNCTNLTEAILPDSVETLSSAFVGCTALKTVKLPQNLKYISNAFDNCTSLKQVALPEGFASINSGGFVNTALEEIKLPHRVLYVHQDAFLGCDNLHTVISDSKYNKWLFKHKVNRISSLIECKHKLLYYLRLMWGYITLPLLHPKIFISSIIHHRELKEQRLKFFEVCGIKNIYLKKGTGHFRIKGYRKVKTDKIAYIKYIKK